MSLILVVEDEPGVRRTMADWLASDGYQVATAADVGQTVAFFQAGRRPDVALVDIKLPDGDGFALADRLREEFAFERVIYVTAFFWEEETRRELAARGQPYFEKPLKFHREVLPFLRRYLGRGETEAGGASR